MNNKKILIAVILISLFFLVPFIIQKQNERRVENSMNNFESALDHYQLAIDELFENNNPDKAISLCNKSLAIFPETRSIQPYSYALSDIYSVRGKAFQKKGEYAKAVEDFTRIIEINSNNPRVISAYNDRAIAKAEMGDYQGSLEDFSKSLELDPNYGGTFWERGLAKIKFNNIESGCTDLKKAYKEGLESVKEDINKYCGSK